MAGSARHTSLYFFLAGIFFSLCTMAQKAEQTDKGQTYALLAGISSYQNKSIPALRFAEKDARLFNNYLQSAAGGNLPVTHIKLLLGADATIAAMYNGLQWLKGKVKKGDRVIIYFSGHGDVETDHVENLGYLLAYNTPPNNYRNNAIRLEDLNHWANEMTLKKKANVVLITDACHSGKLAGDFLKGNQLAAEHLREVLNNEVRITACGPDELAAEGAEWGGGRGVFSFYLLNGLNGLADYRNTGSVQLSDLKIFLDSSFAGDKILKEQKHTQRPMADGHPAFKMAKSDIQTFSAFRTAFQQGPVTPASLPPGLKPLKAIGLQPLDYFFTVLRDHAVESAIDFAAYQKINPSTFPLSLVQACIDHHVEVAKKQEAQSALGVWEDYLEFASLDSLNMLKEQLQKSKDASVRFNELFLTAVHSRAQDMVNAYLAGDMEELEKRQYYFSGSRDFADFLDMLAIANRLVSADHYLAPLLKVHDRYLAGLLERLKMPFSDNMDSLVGRALNQQWQALELEPYAAYIHNELGNLQLRQKQYDSAEYHFDMAVQLAPTWAIPWSNRIRLYLAANQPDKANMAAKKADSLQPNLAFVQMNHGLVSERENNLLAAQMHYRKAIHSNKVHFLPYERLGAIYLQTGDYANADKFLHDASIRKEAFAVNADYYEIGVELGGVNTGTDLEKFLTECNLDTLKGVVAESYIELVQGLLKIEQPVDAREEGARMLSKLISTFPDAPLAHHFLGKYYFHTGDFQQAEILLKKASERFRSGEALRSHLHNAIFGTHSGEPKDTCIIPLLMFFQYDAAEDHYMLGAIYEKRAALKEALEQYAKVAEIEKAKLFAQASFEGYEAMLQSLSGPVGTGGFHPEEILSGMYQRGEDLGGYIKVAQLYERMSDYPMAEKTLLQQVAITRKAGNLRQQAIDDRKPGAYSGGSYINFYWLAVNRNVEAVTYNFYKRMTTLFPRDPEWHKKAGLFLHDRLLLAYEQMPPEMFKDITESIGKYAYPWESGEGGPAETDIAFTLPMTGESISIKMPVYHPVDVSFEWMKQYLALSRVGNPDAGVLAAMAHLNSWLGNTDEAGKWYKKWIGKYPSDSTVRNEAIGYFTAVNYLLDAYAQLDSLYQRKQIGADQLMQLSTGHMLSGHFAPAKDVLKHYTPEGDFEKADFFALKTKISWLSGSTEDALRYLLDSIPELVKKEDEDIEVSEQTTTRMIWKWYSIARLYALQKDTEQALGALKLALDHGFDFAYVLSNDKAWNELRDADAWKKLLGSYEFARTYASESQAIFENPIAYRIPNFSSGYE